MENTGNGRMSFSWVNRASQISKDLVLLASSVNLETLEFEEAQTLINEFLLNEYSDTSSKLIKIKLHRFLSKRRNNFGQFFVIKTLLRVMRDEFDEGYDSSP